MKNKITITCETCNKKIKSMKEYDKHFKKNHTYRKEGLLKAKDDFIKILDECINDRMMKNQNMLTPNPSIVEIKNGQLKNIREEIKKRIEQT